MNINFSNIKAAASFGLSLVLLSSQIGCSKKSDALLTGNNSGATSVTLDIPQIDTGNDAINRIFVSVADQSSNPVTDNFQIGNFSILEAGNPGVPFEVGAVTDPLYLVLALDRSGSMSGSNETAAETAAVDLINALGASDNAALLDFASSVTETVNFTTDKTTLINAINAGTSSGLTSLYDAVVSAANLVSKQPGRRLIIVLTDGVDTSSKSGLSGAIDEANKKGLSVYTVGLGSGFDASILTQLAEATGGSFSSSSTGSGLSTIFLNILNRYNNLYYIKYRRRARGQIQAFINYGGLTASGSKSLD